MSDTIEVFISYSKQDKALRDGLLAHLRPLETQEIITWHDRQILPGTQWDEEIKSRLNAADIILLLISADFLNTDYCTQVEIPAALRRNQAGAIVMPVILRQCGWQYTPLAAIQAYPDKAKPITSWSDIDEAYTDVVNAVYLAATQVRKQRQQQKLNNQQRRQPTVTEKPQPNLADRWRQQTGPDDLSSDRGIDYTQLRNLLKAGKWREADLETGQRMWEVMGRQNEGWLRAEDIRRFPRTDLRTIDRLWVKYSGGQFGFSIQKQIWQECGSPMSHDTDWERFGDRVGWYVSGKWFINVICDTSAPKGHLPFYPFFVGRIKSMRPWLIFSRTAACKL